MKLPVGLFFLTLLCSCAFENATLHSPTGVLTRAEAKRIAEGELRRRNIVLPDRSKVRITTSEVTEEFVPPRSAYLVSFSVPSAEGTTVRYKISINEITGAVEDFTDMNDAVPLRGQ
jgi:hypothetical protein